MKIPLLSITLIFTFCTIYLNAQQQDTTIYSSFDSIPRFEYKNSIDTKESLNLFLSENLKWPNDNDVTGKVYIQCVIEKNGTLSNFKIIRGIEESFDKASLDAIKLMPAWIPGRKNGKIVRSQIVIPVYWMLN